MGVNLLAIRVIEQAKLGKTLIFYYCANHSIFPVEQALFVRYRTCHVQSRPELQLTAEVKMLVIKMWHFFMNVC